MLVGRKQAGVLLPGTSLIITPYHFPPMGEGAFRLPPAQAEKEAQPAVQFIATEVQVPGDDGRTEKDDSKV